MKRSKQLKRLRERGQLDPEKLDAFSRLLDVGNVTHCLYKDSERILGNTFGMCILKFGDWAALVAMTTETAKKKGTPLILKTDSALKLAPQGYNLAAKRRQGKRGGALSSKSLKSSIMSRRTAKSEKKRN